jgi:hypothetical protein
MKDSRPYAIATLLWGPTDAARSSRSARRDRRPDTPRPFTMFTDKPMVEVDRMDSSTTQSLRTVRCIGVIFCVRPTCSLMTEAAAAHVCQSIGSFMPIPDFSIDGLLPPFVGETPAGPSSDMSPYRGSTLDVVQVFAFSEGRKSILRGWLLHRKALRAIGFGTGFQWIDGSFVEKGKEPKDIDTITFLRRPPHARTLHDLGLFWQANRPVLGRAQVKASFHVDFLPLDLDGDDELLVDLTRYYLSLFSHRREDRIWKGMIQVPLDTVAEDDQALQLLGPEPTSSDPVAGDGT